MLLLYHTELRKSKNFQSKNIHFTSVFSVDGASEMRYNIFMKNFRTTDAANRHPCAAAGGQPCRKQTDCGQTGCGQTHNIPPLYGKNSRSLILGSFPSVASRAERFFYAHPQNRFWKVLSAVFSAPLPATIDEKKRLILTNGLALFDVIASCTIAGSADSSVTDVVPNDLSPILRTGSIEHVFVNGKTAEKYYLKYLAEKTGMPCVCLPSTSAANASYSLEKLIAAWNILKN
mgnify:CR=1 FL=1